MSRKDRLALRILPLLASLAIVGPTPTLAQAQGIEVHGHWVIEVRNVDGSLHSRREFRNALTPAGQQDLANVLGRVRTLGFWRVQVTAETASGGFSESHIMEPDFGGNLLVSVVGASVVLQGSFVATEDGNVIVVRTRLDPVNEPQTNNEFTQATGLDVPIQATQTVSVNVTLSFS
jgi:hypothetical protein